MRIGITGGAGFIGSWVIDELLQRGHEPVVFDHRGRAAHREVETMLGSVTDDVAVTELAARVDGIVHLAAVLGTAETIHNPRPAAVTNVQGSLNVFEAANQYDLPCVYAAVGNAWMASEGAGAYVITKTCAENFARMYNVNRRGRIAVVRPMNAYGERQGAATPFGSAKVRKITPAFVCRALSGLPIEVYGDGTQVSDMVYVEDVARTFVHVLVRAAEGQVPDRPVECGPAESLTVNEIAQGVAEAAAELTGGEPVPITHLPMRPGEVPNAVVSADVDTLRAVGIDPAGFTPLDEGLRRTVAWFHMNEGLTWRQPNRESVSA